MVLTDFLQDLLTTGAVTLGNRPATFETADLQAAEAVLRAYHAEDALEMPGSAPAFDASAARWATCYVYAALQLTLVRELDETVMQEYLPDFSGETTPAAVYSVDLSFRYLPDLLRLAKGLAPDDALVTRLRATAQQWPFSFVGSDLAAPEAEAVLLVHPALRQAYVDRIIQAQDQARARQPHLTPLVQEALGHYASTLWPDFLVFTHPI